MQRLVLLACLAVCLVNFSVAEDIEKAIETKLKVQDPMKEMIDNEDKESLPLSEIIKEVGREELSQKKSEVDKVDEVKRPAEAADKDEKTEKYDETDRVNNESVEDDEEDDDHDEYSEEEDKYESEEKSDQDSGSYEYDSFEKPAKVMNKKRVEYGASPVKAELNDQIANNQHDNQVVDDSQTRIDNLKGAKSVKKEPSVFNQLYIVVPIGIVAAGLIIFGTVVLIKKKINKSKKEKVHRNPRNPIYQEVTQAETV